MERSRCSWWKCTGEVLPQREPPFLVGWKSFLVLQGKVASPHFYQLVCFWADMGLRPLNILARNIGGPLGPRHVRIFIS